MQSMLVDAGPLIALFDKSDHYHERAVSFLKKHQGLLITTWPVITEVSHMLDFSTKTQINFLTWINRGGLQIFDLEFYHLIRVIELSEKFQDVPMEASATDEIESVGLPICGRTTSVVETHDHDGDHDHDHDHG